MAGQGRSLFFGLGLGLVRAGVGVGAKPGRYTAAVVGWDSDTL